jgi:hypoxanthine-DNA glycosylase
MSRPDENKNEHPAVHPIPPVYRADSRILILGSFPSVKSRETGFFYGHPQNRFWKVTAAVCGEEVPQTVEEKKAFLLRNHIAVWDVIASCVITGSSDASIRDVVPNPLQDILECADIRQIYCNGATAWKYYRKYQEKQLGRKRFVFRRRVPRTPHGLWSGCLASGASAEKSYETESDRMKKEYETVWEIFNECANNQMRDVFFDEIETDDPEAYIRQKFPDKNLKYEKTVEADGSLVFDIETSGIRQRFTFTEI